MHLVRFLTNFTVFRTFWEFCGISRIFRNFAAVQPREISEALRGGAVTVCVVNIIIVRMYFTVKCNRIILDERLCRPKTGCVRVKVGLTRQLDQRQPGNYFKPWALLHKMPITTTGIRTCTCNLNELH